MFEATATCAILVAALDGLAPPEVFTVPQVVSAIALQNPAVVYRILFRATAETLRTIAADPKHLGADAEIERLTHPISNLPEAVNALRHRPVQHVAQAGEVAP